MAPANNLGGAPGAGDQVAATGSEVASATDGTAEEDPLVCENTVRTGTRVAQRVCMRQSQIDAIARGGQDALGDWQRGGLQTGNQSRD
ncbi:MAG: hypothetical protein WD772_11250 [Pseudohongiellaceae bacterium]